MPIANCLITTDCCANTDNTGDLIRLWANESKVSSEHMTINISVNKTQHGKKYTVMANLLLPSIWSSADVSKLQIGLAKALTSHFNVPPQEVFVATSIIDSGMVVENGNEQKW